MIRVLGMITLRDRQPRKTLTLAWQRARAFKLASQRLLPQRVPLLADSDRMFAELSAECALYEKQSFERGNVDIIMYTPEPPADRLARHAERPINLVSIGATKDHVAGVSGLEFNPQVLRLHQPLQGLQELRILLGQFHVASP